MKFYVTSVEAKDRGQVVQTGLWVGPPIGNRWVMVTAESPDGGTITYGTSDHPQVGDVLEVTVKPAEREAE